MTIAPVTRSPATSGASRRGLILAAATELFRQRGFHGVGIDEIGAAAGISGPGVYRHFASKQALLVALFDRVTTELMHGARSIVGSHPRPERALEALARFHLGFALTDRQLIAVYLQEQHNLPDADRRRIRRSQRLYIEEWVHVAAELRPDLSDGEARLVVHGAFGLMHSVAQHESGLGEDAVVDLLVGMVLASVQQQPEPPAVRSRAS